MSERLDRAVREAVRDLAAQARPADLARSAIVRGIRLRRRMVVLRTAGATVAGIAVLAAIIVPSVLFGRPQHPLTPSTVGPTTPAPVVSKLTGDLPGGWIVIQAGDGPYQVWNRDRQAYERIDAPNVFAAPAGPYVMTFGEQTNSFDILDLRGRAPRHFTLPDQFILSPHWSADGTRLLLTTPSKETGAVTATIVDAGSGRISTFPIDSDAYFCSDWCEFIWTRDGTEFGWSLTDQSVARSEAEPHARSGLQLFSATDGRPTRTLKVRGEPAGPFSWSPNGRTVLVRGVVTENGQRRSRNQLVDVGTGAVLREFATQDAYWISNDRIAYAGPGMLVHLTDANGIEVATYATPEPLASLWPVLLGQR